MSLNPMMDGKEGEKIDSPFEEPPKNVDEFGLPLDSTGDPLQDKEIVELRNICRTEGNHGQWKKWFSNLFCLALLILISILRGG